MQAMQASTPASKQSGNHASTQASTQARRQSRKQARKRSFPNRFGIVSESFRNRIAICRGEPNDPVRVIELELQSPFGRLLGENKRVGHFQTGASNKTRIRPRIRPCRPNLAFFICLSDPWPYSRFDLGPGFKTTESGVMAFWPLTLIPPGRLQNDSQDWPPEAFQNDSKVTPRMLPG